MRAEKSWPSGTFIARVDQHEAVSHAMATIFDLGHKSGLFDTYIRTDIQRLTKRPIAFAETTSYGTILRKSIMKQSRRKSAHIR